MGFETALLAAAAIGGVAYNSHQQKKASEAAVKASKEAALRNVSVGVSQADPNAVKVDSGEAMEVSEQNARKRRVGVGSTVNRGALLSSSLTGNRVLLGG